MIAADEVGELNKKKIEIFVYIKSDYSRVKKALSRNFTGFCCYEIFVNIFYLLERNKNHF